VLLISIVVVVFDNLILNVHDDDADDELQYSCVCDAHTHDPVISR